MFWKFTRKDKRTKLEKEIESVLDRMSLLEPDSKEYTAMVVNLEKLYKALPTKGERKVSWDTIITVAGSLLGIVLITKHEKTDIITTKALGFISKGRV